MLFAIQEEAKKYLTHGPYFSQTQQIKRTRNSSDIQGIIWSSALQKYNCIAHIGLHHILQQTGLVAAILLRKTPIHNVASYFALFISKQLCPKRNRYIVVMMESEQDTPIKALPRGSRHWRTGKLSHVVPGGIEVPQNHYYKNHNTQNIRYIVKS